MKRFTQLMSLLFMAAVTQYSCINDADVAFSDESHTDLLFIKNSAIT